MTDREKLIALIARFAVDNDLVLPCASIADHLIANGVEIFSAEDEEVLDMIEQNARKAYGDMRYLEGVKFGVEAATKHGHWKYGTRAAVCSECGFERHLDDNFGSAIACPNCGARMDGDGKATTTPTADSNYQSCKHCNSTFIGLEEYAECPVCGQPFEEDANG